MIRGMRQLGLWGVMWLAAACAPAFADERPVDRDWRTGVAVAPGATTWMNDHIANKQQLINETAAAQGKTCTDKVAFIGWGIGNGGPGVIIPKTRESYEKAGYSVEPLKGTGATDTVWIVRNQDREAVVLLDSVAGSTIYLSCLTAGTPAADPDKPLYLGVLAGLGLGALLAGLWLGRRVRAPHTATEPQRRGKRLAGLVLAICGALCLVVAAVIAFVI